MENDFSIDSYVRFASTQGIEALMITGFLKSGIEGDSPDSISQYCLINTDIS